MIDIPGLQHKEVVEDLVVDETDDCLPLVVRKALDINTADPQRPRAPLALGGCFLSNSRSYIGAHASFASSPPYGLCYGRWHQYLVVGRTGRVER